MDYFVSIIAGFALGAVPFAYVLGRLRHVDVTQRGTRNPGAANLFREVSRPLGVVAIALDTAKGSGAVLIGFALGLEGAEGLAPGASAVLGHLYTPVLRFRGGAGLATTIGVGLGVLPIAAGVGFGVGIAMTLVLRNTGRGAGIGFAAFLALGIALGDPWPSIGGIMALGFAITGRALMRELSKARASDSSATS